MEKGRKIEEKLFFSCSHFISFEIIESRPKKILRLMAERVYRIVLHASVYIGYLVRSGWMASLPFLLLHVCVNTLIPHTLAYIVTYFVDTVFSQLLCGGIWLSKKRMSIYIR